MKGLISRPPISVFLNSTDEPYRRNLHCISCGLPYVTVINYTVYKYISNEGLGEEILDFGPRLTLICKRCGQHYNLHYKI